MSSGFKTFLVAIAAVLIVGGALFWLLNWTPCTGGFEGRAQADIQHMHYALAEHALVHGDVPASLGTNLQAWLPQTFDFVDPWGSPYIYAKSSMTNYSLSSAGADGIAGTDDDINSEY